MAMKDRLLNALAEYGIPVAETCFDDEQIPPFAIMLRDSTSNAYSDDGRAIKRVDHWQIEFYHYLIEDRTAFESFMTEERIPWDCMAEDTYIADQSIYLSRYTIYGT